MINYLKKTEFFQGVPDDDLAEIVNFCHHSVLPAGSRLFDGDQEKNYDIYLFVSGSINVVASVSEKKTSHEMVLSGSRIELIGEMAWLMKSPRSAVIHCRSEVTIVRIDGEALDAFILERPDIGVKLMHRMAKELAVKLNRTKDIMRMFYKNSMMM